MKFKTLLLVFIVVVLSATPIFFHLGSWHIRIWDEARYANNAIDMLVNKNPLVVSFEGKPDLYNTKPPFVIWCEAISMSVFGINGWALRLPTALFAFATVLLLLYFAFDVLNNPVTGYISVLTLISSQGFVDKHVSRTGDLDGILSFWTTFYFLIFIRYLIKRGHFNTHLIFISIGVFFAFLTKGVAGLFFLPFMIIITMIDKNYKLILFRPHVYIYSITTIFLIVIYYLLREYAAPGYWDVVYQSEFSRYSKNVMPWHEHPFDYYFKILYERNFIPFIYFIPFVSLVFLISKNENIIRTLLYLLVGGIGYALFMSYPQVKLFWYLAPIYPTLSLVVGIFFNSIYQTVIEKYNYKYPVWVLNCTLIVLTAAVFLQPYIKILNNIYYAGQDIEELEREGAYIRHLGKTKPQYTSYSILKSLKGSNDQMLFYKRAAEINKGFKLRYISSVSNIKDEELILVCESDKIDSLNATGMSIIDSWNGCNLMIKK